jgi:hypothetical protein
MSRRHAPLLFAFVALAPASALAAGDCPDGWFCDEGGAARPHPPAPEPPNAGPTPGERPAPPSPPPEPGSPASEPGYEPPSYPPPGYGTPRYAPPGSGARGSGPPGYGPPGELPDEAITFRDPDREPAPTLPRRLHASREWGFNLHLEDALLGNRAGRASNAQMAGLGFALRFRPLPLIAFEAGVDLLTGTDYNGYDRTEAALLLNTLVFFNPHDIVQVYALGGLGFSGADVTIAPHNGESFPSHDEHYSYVGGQLGLGAEIRVSRRLAIAGDLIGFVRDRTDDEADIAPEYTDPNSQRTTNTSGGGLIRIGATFYW